VRNRRAHRPTTDGMSQSIFGSLATARSLSACSRPETREQPAKRPAPANAIEARDEAFIAIIEAPLKDGETAYFGFARKEEELRAAFASLSVIESLALRSRLCNPRSYDRFAVAFSRLTVDRRVRLIYFLANARRREALNSARKETQ
jgi:hypothetical protein